MTLYSISFFEKNKEPVKIIICDLAGVENVFNCDDTNEIQNFLNILIKQWNNKSYMIKK